MDVIRQIGVNLSIISTIFMLIVFVLNITNIVFIYIHLLIALLTLLGLILMAKKGSGKGLILFSGVLLLLFGILYYLDPIEFQFLAPYSFFMLYLNFEIPYITIETLLMLIGGILIYFPNQLRNAD